MAVNQSQVDHIITAASEDDPEVKLQNLEREVDLIKTSIKRLLIDIRERMNELENPFTLATAVPAAAGGVDEPIPARAEARPSAPEAPEIRSPVPPLPVEPVVSREVPPPQAAPIRDTKRAVEEVPPRFPHETLSLSHTAPAAPVAPDETRLRLQKVYKLFKWTKQAVRKVGHDRLEIILESYRAMGFITRESCDEIKEISRLMPASLGEDHEVGPDEFVSDLYALNRILAPNDTSMDRDMIEVLMELRQEAPPAREKGGGAPMEIPRISVDGKKSSLSNEREDEWMHLPDRI